MRRMPSALWLVPLAVGGAAMACSTDPPTPAHNPGDTLIVDVEASALPPQTSTDADLDPDGIFDPVDSSSIYGQANYDGEYPVLSVCAPPDGGTPTASGDGGAKADTDAGEAAKVDAGTSSPQVYGDGGYASGDAGCQAFPPSCAGEADPCVCLLTFFSAQVSCVPSCEVKLDGSGFSIYCPP
jgi:hypothetical protein